jgi:hypothetical protein
MTQMLVRVLTAQVAAQNVAEANVLVRQLLAELHQQPGLAYAKLARRLLEGDDEEMILIQEWLTPADLFAWTCGRLQKPRIPDRALRLLENLVITHYESLDRMPEDLELEVIRSERLAGEAPEQPSEAGRPPVRSLRHLP